MRALLLILILLVQIAMPAVAGLNADGSLDRAKISKAYFEGDFDLAVEALETFRKLHPNPSREDKIYAYKYLSVIYAAKPETRAKAESFMYQLLKIMPSIELMDLYISDNIEAIFNSVRARFEQQQRLGVEPAREKTPAPATKTSAASPTAPSRNPGAGTPKPAGKSTSADKGSSSWVWWTVGAVGVAAAVSGYILLAESPATESNETVTLE